jgi:hypothetical protein
MIRISHRIGHCNFDSQSVLSYTRSRLGWNSGVESIEFLNCDKHLSGTDKNR